MIKKLFFISLFLFVLLLILLVAYNFAFKNNKNNPKTNDSKEITEELDNALKGTDETPAASTKIDNPLNEEVAGVVSGPNGEIFYYSFSDEQVKKATIEGRDKQTLLSNLPGTVERLVWSPDRTQVLIGLRQGSALRWHHLAINSKTLTPLKASISRVAWSQNGERIYYQYNGSKGERFLDTSNPDGNNFSTVTKLTGSDNFIESIPQSGRVSFWTRPSGLESTTFESIEKDGSDKKTLLSNRYGADFLWAPNGKSVLFSASRTRAGSDISLALMNDNGGEIRDLSIPTLISKVVWSKDSKTLYYALPGNLPSESVLPNDYFQKPLYSEDTFWKIDTETGQKSRILELGEGSASLDSSDLFLSPKEDLLFFTDRKTKRLYRIEL
jgi:hypothetical protein